MKFNSKWIQLTIAIITVIVTVTTIFYSAFRSNTEAQYSRLLAREMQYTAEKRFEVIDSIMNSMQNVNDRIDKLLLISKSDESFSLIEGENIKNIVDLLNSNKTEITNISNQYQGLRQAINPVNPEEIVGLCPSCGAALIKRGHCEKICSRPGCNFQSLDGCGE